MLLALIVFFKYLMVILGTIVFGYIQGVRFSSSTMGMGRLVKLGGSSIRYLLKYYLTNKKILHLITQKTKTDTLYTDLYILVFLLKGLSNFCFDIGTD